MQKITGFFTYLMRKYLPDRFVFAVGLTLLTMLLAVVVQGRGIVLPFRTCMSLHMNAAGRRAH